MIEPKIITANQLPKIPNIYALLVGEGGVGKTYFAATFPKPFFLTFKMEPRQGSIEGMGDHIKIGYIDALNGLTEFQYMEEVYLKDSGWFFQQLKDPSNPLDIKTLVLDSLSSLWKVCAYDTLGVRYDDKYSAANSKRDIDQLESKMTFDQRDITNNKVLSVVNRLAYYARVKNLNFIITGHLAVKETKDGDEVLRLLVGSKNFSTMKLLPFIDHKVIMDVDSTSKRWLNLDKTTRYPDAGCTTKPGHVLPQKISDITYEGFVKAIGYTLPEQINKTEKETK